jgi:drug/metabolite transporter (DMT)-like permease
LSNSQTPREKNDANRSLALGTSFVLLWCTGYPAGKIALGHAAPFTLLTLRFGIAALIYVLLFFSFTKKPWPSWRESRHSVITGFLSLAMQFGGVYLGIALGASAGFAALVIGIMPIVTALFGTFIGEPIRRMQWFGFALGFVGVALVVADKVEVGNVPLGAYIALAVGLTGISAGTLYQKRFGSSIDLRAGLALQHICAALVLIPFAMHESFRFDGTTPFYESLGWLVLINSVGGFALLFVLIQRGAATSVAALFFLMPPVTAVMNYFVIGEPLTLLKGAGFVLAAVGVYIGTRSVARQRHAMARHSK